MSGQTMTRTDMAYNHLMYSDWVIKWLKAVTWTGLLVSFPHAQFKPPIAFLPWHTIPAVHHQC